jgi:type IV pilus assembly protein PilY1
MNTDRHSANCRSPKRGCKMRRLVTLLFAVLIGALSGLSATLADDTEIFMTQFSGTGVSGGRPKVLIIFDTSGSMGNGVPQSKPDYDAAVDWTDSTEYPGAPANFQRDLIYWSFDGDAPIKTTDRYVPQSSNQCATSITPLVQTGRYTDYVMVWREGTGVIGTESIQECQCQWSRNGSSWKKSKFHFEGITQSECESHQGYNNNDYRLECETYDVDEYGPVDMWRSVEDNNDTRTAIHLECAADIDADDPTNPNTTDGYASDIGGPFRTGSAGAPWDNWSSRHDGDLTRTLFTGNYLAWYYNDDLIENRSKLEIAQDVVTELIANNPQVDFGMMLFNNNSNNSNKDGGRVVAHLDSMSSADRTALIQLIDETNDNGWTPLCETFYEAYRYIARPNDAPLSVFYGDNDPNRSPKRDACAELENDNGTCSHDGTYRSPMGDCENIYLVLMTDGKPTYDLDANPHIRRILGINSCDDYATDHSGALQENCMPKLARHMYESDLDDRWQNGEQRVITYTIGFLTDQDLLRDTAEFGGGTYFTAYNAHELADAFQATLTEILSSNTSFAAPAVAVDAYNRTKSLNAEYIAMFRPSSRPRWPGNLKMLKMEIIPGTHNEEVVDKNGVRAIDPLSGLIKDTATTFWTTGGVDGMEVDEGGAGERLVLRTPSSRVIYTDTGTNGALESFDTSNANLTATMIGATDSTERENYINWARGVDVQDENSNDDTTDARPWILGDIMHSTPEAINFGNAVNGVPDVRIVFGTNAGFLHMIKSTDGSETWAFFPKGLGAILSTLYQNRSDDDHPYGIDGSPGVYVNDIDGDGDIEHADGDKVLIYFGLRRGTASTEGGDGGGYYALDISNPDSPALLWQVDRNDLTELGQSWSKPTITMVPGYANPVVIVGAGYDTNKDAPGVGQADSEGRGIYMLDAYDGTVVWSLTPAADSDTNKQETGLLHSVPAQVTPIDSNGDHVADRLYFPDTGGNIWRVDMPDTKKANWSVFKLASLSGGTLEADRRFMYRVDVAVTKSERYDISFDALMIGSGNRARPLDRDTKNRFYMIRDVGIESVLHVPNDDNPDANACDDLALNPDSLPCREIPPVITESALYDATANRIQDGTAAQKTAAITALSNKSGWYIQLERTGEKSLSRSITLQGRVFFTTYVPPDPYAQNVAQVCRPSEGIGFLYAVGLHDATAQYDWATPFNQQLEKIDRRKPIKDHIPDYPVAYFGSTEIGLVGVGAGTAGTGIEQTGLALTLSPVYWMQQED